MQGQRVAGIESIRGLAAVSIVCIHSLYLPQSYADIEFFVRMIFARFAIPFFFISSGFFYAKGLSERAPEKQFEKSCSRVVLFWGVWSLIYFLNPNFHLIAEKGVLNSYLIKVSELVATKDLSWFLIVGPTGLLWFFLALSVSMLIFRAFSFEKRVNAFLCLSFLIYIVGVLNSSYRATPVGLIVSFK